MFDIESSQKHLFVKVIFDAVILLREFVTASLQEILILVALQSIRELLHCTFSDGYWLFDPLATI